MTIDLGLKRLVNQLISRSEENHCATILKITLLPQSPFKQKYLQLLFFASQKLRTKCFSWSCRIVSEISSRFGQMDGQTKVCYDFTWQQGVFNFINQIDIWLTNNWQIDRYGKCTSATVLDGLSKQEHLTFLSVD